MSGTAEGARPSAPRVRVPGVAIAALVLLVLGVLSLAPAVSTYLGQQREIADTEARIATQKAELQHLDEHRVGQVVEGRELFYVTPGTTAYRVIHAKAGTAAAPTPATTAQPDRTPWTAALLQSLVAAGTTTEPAR
jgi:hypothetical protein